MFNGVKLATGVLLFYLIDHNGDTRVLSYPHASRP